MRIRKYAWLLPLSLGCARAATTPTPVSTPVPTPAPAPAPTPAHGPEGRTPPAASGADLVARNRIFPVATYHQHLVGPTYLARWHTEPMPSASLPRVLDDVLRGHRALIGAAATSEAHEDVYATDARLLVPEQVVEGAAAIARYWRGYTSDGFVRYVVPTRYELRDDDGYIVGIMVEARPDSSTRYARRLMHVLINVQKGGGRWRIVAESGTPMSRAMNTDTITAADLIAQMNEAGVTHGVIAAAGYDVAAEGSERRGELADVQAENDWTVRQAAQFPGRLVVFCGIHPLRNYAIPEMDRCARMPGVRGIKVYIRQYVDLEAPADVETLRAFFRAANERRLALLVHVSVDSKDGARHSRIFLEQVVPAAPDIPIQIAHMGQGGAYSLGRRDDALKVYADAAAAGSPLMKNLYFDLAGTVRGAPAAALGTLAERMRTIGLQRIVFGSDLPFYPLGPVAQEWALFRRVIPLTNDELRIIADNVAPYAR